MSTTVKNPSVEQQRLGKRIQGPSALGGSPRRFFNLVQTLAITDFRLKFYGSALGYLWQLMRPLLLFGVLYVVFTKFMNLGSGLPHYPLMLLTGIVLFIFFSEATAGSVSCVIERETLVRKVHFPRLVIPLSVVLTSLFNLGLNMIVVFIFIIMEHGSPHLTWLELPLIFGAITILATGCSTLLSCLYVRYRDIRPIWDVILQMLFYGSPVIYPIEKIQSEKIRELLMLNPFAAIIQQARHALIDPSSIPSAATVAGGHLYLLVPAGLTVGLFLVGLYVFNREAPRIAEEL